MKNLVNLFNAFRPTVTIPAAFLIHVSYHVAHQSTDWLLVVLMFFIAGLTMLQNDYFDREHDLKKGKDFVATNRNMVQSVLVIGWLMCILGSAVFFYDKLLILFPMICIGFSYSYFKQIQFIPLLIVTVMSALPVLVAGVPHLIFAQQILFASVAMVILGRELLKDIEDAKIDVGYKATLVTAGWFSEKQVHTIAGTSIAIGALLSILLMYSLNDNIQHLCYFLGFSLITTAVFFITYLNEATKGKELFDMGMVGILIALSI